MTETFISTYLMTSKVRSKLVRESSNSKSELRKLVLQSNMLDRLLDKLDNYEEERSQPKEVKFEVPIKPKTTITYESDEDSDSDSDSDEDVFSTVTYEEIEFDDEDDEDYEDYNDSVDSLKSIITVVNDDIQDIDACAISGKIIDIQDENRGRKTSISKIDAKREGEKVKLLHDKSFISIIPKKNINFESELESIEEEDWDFSNDEYFNSMPELSQSTSLTDDEEDISDIKLDSCTSCYTIQSGIVSSCNMVQQISI